MKQAVETGSIVRDLWPLDMGGHVNMYLGSGRMGACFDAFGLMNRGFRGRPKVGISNTWLMHADHWHRGGWGMDFWLPIGRLAWAGEPPDTPKHYRQALEIYDGRLTTGMAWPDLRATMRTFFHPERRDLLAVDLRFESTCEGKMPDLLLAPELDMTIHYNQHLTGDAESLEFDQESGWWLCRVKVGTADSLLALKIISTDGRAVLQPTSEGMAIGFEGGRGRHFLLIGIAGSQRREQLCEEMHSIRVPEQYATEAVQAWHRRWGDAFIQVPVPEYQAMWARSLYYLLCSCGPDVAAPSAPMGWSGNGWPFGFPQDLSYIHPVFLRLGHLDIARAWVEFYRSRLEDMREYTKAVYGAEGTMWAWEFPIGPDSKFLQDGAPNWCQYEIHNAAYPVRMAYEAAQHLRDPEWARDIAWPIARESARFYSSVLKPEDDGTWGMHVIPSMGQDERGGQDARNYLCALFSARYTLQTALRMAEELHETDPETDRWRAILANGLAFTKLYDEAEGLCVTCEGLRGREQLGEEKHPVQLNPLIFLPTGEADGHVIRAYERRYDLCAGVRESHYHGWTLAVYLLAASHMGDADGLLKELGQMLPARYTDADWMQIYETSGALTSPYYVTSHGLYLQTLNDALVSDYWGDVRIGAACPEEWREVRFANLRTADGRVHSGGKTGGEEKLTVDSL